MGKNQDPGSGINIPDPQHCVSQNGLPEWLSKLLSIGCRNGSYVGVMDGMSELLSKLLSNSFCLQDSCMILWIVSLNCYLTVVLWLLFTKQLQGPLDGLPEWLSKLLSHGCCLQGSYVVLRMVCLHGDLNCCPMVAVYKAAAECFSGWFAWMVIWIVVLWLLFTRELHDSLAGLSEWLSKWLAAWFPCRIRGEGLVFPPAQLLFYKNWEEFSQHTNQTYFITLKSRHSCSRNWVCLFVFLNVLVLCGWVMSVKH
jgi:hypothetical protein